MNMKASFLALMAMVIMCGCSSSGKYDRLQESLEELVRGKDANIGIAVIIDETDTVAVNGNERFPMLSVYKFPIALALAEHFRQLNLSADQPISFRPDRLDTDTYSPMTKRLLDTGAITADTITMPARELLAYMLQLSDNNASDIILDVLHGPATVDSFLWRTGEHDISVRNSEAEMHADNSLCYDNWASPMGMARLMDRFDREHTDTIALEIKSLMENCTTGTNRLARPLAGAVVGHKTGTGFDLPEGRLMAINDAGYIHLPDGHRYAIAVFIENSGYDTSATESLIADISATVAEHVSGMQR